MATSTTKLTNSQTQVLDRIIEIGIQRGEDQSTILLAVQFANAESTFNPNAIGPNQNTTISGTFQYRDDTWITSFNYAKNNEPDNTLLNGSAMNLKSNLEAQITIMYSDLSRYESEFDTGNYPKAFAPSADRPTTLSTNYGIDIYSDFDLYAYARHNTMPSQINNVVKNVFDKYNTQYTALVGDIYNRKTSDEPVYTYATINLQQVISSVVYSGGHIINFNYGYNGIATSRSETWSTVDSNGNVTTYNFNYGYNSDGNGNSVSYLTSLSETTKNSRGATIKKDEVYNTYDLNYNLTSKTETITTADNSKTVYRSTYGNYGIDSHVESKFAPNGDLNTRSQTNYTYEDFNIKSRHIVTTNGDDAVLSIVDQNYKYDANGYLTGTEQCTVNADISTYLVDRDGNGQKTYEEIDNADGSYTDSFYTNGKLTRQEGLDSNDIAFERLFNNSGTLTGITQTYADTSLITTRDENGDNITLYNSPTYGVDLGYDTYHNIPTLVPVGHSEPLPYPFYMIDDPLIYPIGAFYEVTTPANDNAPSIAGLTGRVMLNGNSINKNQLAALDTNSDEKITAVDTGFGQLTIWQDMNENGKRDEGEIKTLPVAAITTIKAEDYKYLTAGNGEDKNVSTAQPQKIIPGSETIQPNKIAPPAAAPTIDGDWYLNNSNVTPLFVFNSRVYWYTTGIKLDSSRTIAIGTNGNDEFTATSFSVYFNPNAITTYIAGAGDDRIGGNDGANTMYGGTGNDLLLGYGGADVINGEDGYDQIEGGDGNDTLYGLSGDDIILGDTGNDIIMGGIGNDAMAGGAGQDIILGEDGKDEIYGDSENDYLDGGAGDDLISGGIGDEAVFGGTGNDELQGNDGNDRLVGEDGNDLIFGQTGNDTLYGGDGDDTLVGFTMGNETKQTLSAGETDNDTIFGGSGDERIVAGPGEDILFGEEGADAISGDSGNDYVDGGAGDDMILGGSGADTVFGSTGNDELQGNDGTDRLAGENGNDRIFGQTGNDTLYGGDGDDVLVGFTGSNEAKQTLSAGETDNDVIYGAGDNDTIVSGLGDDTAFGGTGNDEIQGNEGNDYLYGNDGNDRIFGQTGNDVIYGGEGNDLVVGFTASNETKQTLNPGETDADILYGGAGNDTLLGGLGDDYLDGGAGADRMEGGKGDDIYIVNSVNDVILEKQNEGYDAVLSSSTYLLNAEIEELKLLGAENINGTGNSRDNLIIGNSGNNILDGVTGADTMIGQQGDDVYYVDNINDTTTEVAGEGTDTVLSTISRTLDDNLENLTLLSYRTPEQGLVDGEEVFVYGYPKRYELDYMQGDAVPDYLGTCALTSISNLLTQAGVAAINEAAVVKYAIATGNATTPGTTTDPYKLGGSNYLQQMEILNHFGLKTGLIQGYSAEFIADRIREGRGVLLGVNAGKLWGDAAYIGNNLVNHLITVSGVVYDEDNTAIKGFYICDSGRQQVSDMVRYVNLEDFSNAATVGSSYTIYTQDTIKLWDININGTGNKLNNIISGTEGNNILDGGEGNDALYGGAGNDTLIGSSGDHTMEGGSGDDILRGGSGDDTYRFGAGSGNDVIEDVDVTPGNIDRIVMGEGITPENITVTRDVSHLILNLNNTGETLSVLWAPDEGKVVEQVEFSSGMLWDIFTFQSSAHFVPQLDNPLDDRNAAEDRQFNFTVPANTFSDLDEGATLTLAATRPDGSPLPAWLTFDAATQTFSGIPGNGDVGSLDVKVIAFDNHGAKSSDVFRITVANFNDAPVVANPLLDQRVIDGQSINLKVPANAFFDEDAGDSLTFSVSLTNGGSLPSWLTFNAAIRTFSGVAPYAAAGNYDLRVTAVDGSGIMVSDDFTLTVVAQSATVIGTAGGDYYLSGTPGADVIDGLGGNDNIYGGAGSDIYLFGRGSGHDTIFEHGDDSTKADVDRVRFASNVAPADITVSRTLYDLEIGINGTQDRLTLGYWFLTYGKNIEQIEFSNGLVWNVADITRLASTASATEYQDVIVGSSGNDTISALGGRDLIYGGNGDDVIDAGPGNDYLYGGLGNDVFLFGRGSGRDTIVYDSGYYHNSETARVVSTLGMIDTLLFASDVAPSDVRVFRDQYSLFLQIQGTQDRVELNNWFGSLFPHQTQRVEFKNGTVWNAAVLSAFVSSPTEGNDNLSVTTGAGILNGLGGDDILQGGSGDDKLDGGTGNDVLTGSLGNDTYYFGNGYGLDTIDDLDWRKYSNRIVMKSGVLPSAVKVSRSESDLYLILNGGEDKLAVSTWFGSDGSDDKVIRVEFANGTVWDVNAIKAMLPGATNGDDVLEVTGTGGSMLSGLGGNDILLGRTGNDTLDGGIGNDLSSGGCGNDTYVFGRGYGHDIVFDEGSSNSSEDTVRLGGGIVASDVALGREGLDLLLSINGTDDMLRMQDWFGYSGYFTIERLQFQNDTVWTNNTVSSILATPTTGNDTLAGTNSANSLSGLGGNDRLFGDAGNDTLDGGAGSDILFGGYGADTYVFGNGYGQDKVSSIQSGDTQGDKVLFSAGVLPASVTVTRSESDLYITLNNGADRLTIEEWFDYEYYRPQLQFSDGTIWSDADVQARLSGITENADIFGGESGNDVFNGLGGNDTLLGGGGDDVIDGGAGTDILNGQGGSDVFFFGRNGGRDVVIANVTGGADGLPDTDTVRFKSDVASGDIVVSRNQDNLYLSIKGTDDRITLANWFVSSAANNLDQVEFANGTNWYREDLARLAGEWPQGPKIVTPLPDQVTMQETPFQLAIADSFFTDNDGTLSFTATLANGDSLPSWLIFDAVSHSFSGLPGNSDVGKLSITVTAANDFGYGVSDSFDLDIVNINDAPKVVAALANQNATEDAAFNITIPANTFSDADVGDRLSYKASRGDDAALPAWLSFNAATRTFSGTPVNGDVGMVNLKVTATDQAGVSVSSQFNLAVANTNDAPTVVAAIANPNATEDAAFSFNVASSFSDVDVGDTLSYTAARADGAALPAWLSFNAATRTFSGTPVNGDVGMVNLKVTATDQAGVSVSSQFNLAVANTNDAPTVVAAIANQNATEDTAFSFNVANSFSDVDVGDTLSYTAARADGTSLPAWLSFNSETRTLSCIPVNDNVGSLEIKINATDKAGEAVSSNFNLTVVNTNEAPKVVAVIANQNATEDATFSFNAANSFSDVDAGDILAYKATKVNGTLLPSWLNFNTATGTFSGAPVNDDVGEQWIKVTATDITGASVSCNFILTVANVNDAPTVSAALANQNATEDAAFSFTISADTFNDVDAGDTLTYSATLADGAALPSWLTFNSATMTFSGMPICTGTIGIKVNATDSSSTSVSNIFNLDIQPSGFIGTANDDNLTGTIDNNVIYGFSGNDTIDGGAGADTMFGGSGNDTYVMDNTSDVITENSNEGTDIIQGSVTYTLNANVENLTLTGTSAINGTGNELNNYLTGNSAVNRLTGSAGNDTLNGGTGADTMLGGLDDDVYNVENTADVVTESVNEGSDSVLSTVTYTLAANVENLTLTGTAAINGTGNTLNNVINGNSVNNTLSGGTGADTMIGGTGNDVYVVDNTGDGVTENANEGTDTVYSSITYSLESNVEKLILTGKSAIDGIGNTLDNYVAGNTAANTLTGDAGNDMLSGGTGVDAMIGGLGNDAYIVDNIGDVVTENANEGTDIIQSSVTYTLSTNVENLTLTGTSAVSGTGHELENYLTGNSAANTLTGAAGNDTLSGGAGVDTMIGGLGNDIYIVDNTGDSVTEYAGEGADIIQSSVNYTLSANVENLTLTGSAISGTGNELNNYLTGNSAANTLNGAAGNDILNGGRGIDTMIGGLGDDTYIVDSTNDIVTENADEGTDTVQSPGTYTLGANVENLKLTTPYNYNGTGNTLNNVIIGGSGSNTLNGGAGADTMLGGAGNDTYVVDDIGDFITENNGEGTDAVQSSVAYTLSANVENLTLTGTAAINGTGNELNNAIVGNSADNILSGGTGTDTMRGGAGNDTYIVDSSSDSITENANEGTDTVQSSITYTLSANVENLTLTGITAINGTGNTLGNYLIGNSAINILTGNAGSDTLDGGTGNDTLTGGNGSDTYLFRRTDGQDTLNETVGVSGDIDNLQLADGIATTEPVLVKQNNDLYVFIDSNNYMKIVSEFQKTNYGIERLEVTDGHYITRADIQTIVDTMSAINNNSGMDVMQKYNAMMNDQQYQNILAESWHQ